MPPECCPRVFKTFPDVLSVWAEACLDDTAAAVTFIAELPIKGDGLALGLLGEMAEVP